MGVEFVADVNGVQLRLLKPNVGDGKLIGKTIVVDAGHGGTDSGSSSAGIYEKNLTLPVARMLAEELAREGAVVIMTRKDDTYPTLVERAALANRNNADCFVSVHINKIGATRSTSKSGTITFYHGGQKSSEVLAECIQHEVAAVSKLPSIGVWSDTKIYDSGFSVLRNTTRMPGVLVELGFINNATDRKRMATADFQQSAALAIVKGIKKFLGIGSDGL
jgi:N-acetylmuramoyl-L-alanine amidase